MKSKIAAAVCMLVLALGAGIWFYADYRLRNEVDIRLQSAVDSGSYDALYYDDLSFALNGDVTLTNLHVEQLGFDYMLEQVVVSNMDYGNEIPRQVDVTIKGLQFPGGLPDLSNTENASLGLLLSRIAQNDTIPLEIGYKHRYDPDNAFQLNTDVFLLIPSLMQMNMSSTMRNLPLENLSAYNDANMDPAQLQAQLMPLMNQAEFPSFHLQLEDQGLVQAMVDIGAADFSTPPEDYRNMLVSQAKNAYLFLPQSTHALVMNAGNQLAAFLEGGRTLSLKLQPEFNGSIQKLQPQIMGAVLTGDVNSVAELLNLEFIAL